MGVRLPSHGPWRMQRAWGPPPDCRAQDMRSVSPTIAWYARALFILPCPSVLAVRLSCLQRTLATRLKILEMGVHLPSLGPWRMQRAWREPPACRAQGPRLVPPIIAWYHSRALCDSVRSRSGGAPVVPPAHARGASKGTRDVRALAIARAVAYATGLRPAAHMSVPPTGACYHPRALCDSVRSRSGMHLSCLQRTLAPLLKAREMGVRLPSLGPWLTQRVCALLPACELRAYDQYHLRSRGTLARSLSWRALPYWRPACRASSARSRRC